eukprot:gene12375-13648_t
MEFSQEEKPTGSPRLYSYDPTHTLQYNLAPNFGLPDKFLESDHEEERKEEGEVESTGMKIGTLDPVLFGIYNLQDAVYCYNSIKCLNLVAKKSTGDMKKYSKHELSVPESMDPIYSFIAMIPCSRLWPWLWQQLKEFRDQFGVYKEWIDENLTGTSYIVLEKFVEDHSATVDKQKALDIYKKSMKCEYEFFNSAQ